MAYRFSTPANIVDFPDEPALQQSLNDLWNTRAYGWTREAILGNPWNAQYMANQDFYYDPTQTTIPPGAAPVMVSWFAKPNRIDFYFPNLSQNDRWSLADTGYTTTGATFPTIPPPSVICGGSESPNIKYGPYGPRGWQDEYCEWSVLRDDKGNIVRVDFTCENPEYWNSLWRTSPEQALAIYQTTLDNPNITLEDLYLTFNGETVTDPVTGLPVYNPLNIHNRGPVRTAAGGGAMHLTSTPNSLQTEMQLAGGATILRTTGNSNANALLCCAQYGQPHRNSDPTIGQSANIAVAGTGGNLNKIALANPIGLYLQMPTFAGWLLPKNAPKDAKASDYWTVKRGVTSLPGFPAASNFILHATYEVPAELGFTVSDITINGANIKWAAQMAATFKVALFPLPIPTTEPQTPQPCVVFTNPPQASPQPLQLMFANIWNAMYNTPVDNPVGGTANLAGNSLVVPPIVVAGGTYDMVLTCDSLSPAPGLTVSFVMPGSTTPDPNITVTVGDVTSVTYAVPGNSYPGTYNAVSLNVVLGNNVASGIRDVIVNNPAQTAGPAALAYLYVS
jgi:hypothetical protein